jgi:hypothetical protein
VDIEQNRTNDEPSEYGVNSMKNRYGIVSNGYPPLPNILPIET